MLALPVEGMVAVFYKNAQPHISRFYSRMDGIRKNGYKAFYNSAFRLEKVEELHKGVVIRKWLYTYRTDGTIKGCDRHEGAAGRVWGWRFDNAGRILSRIQFVGQGAYNRPYLVYLYSYNARGHLHTEREMSGDKMLRSIQYTYHPGGEILSKGIYNITGYLLERTVYRTDDAGRIQESLHYRWGQLFKIYVHRYSADGCPLELEERKLIPGDPVRDPLLEPVKPLPTTG